MIWSELMAAVRRSGLSRAELARHLEVEELVLADFERSDGYVEGEVQVHILSLAYEQRRGEGAS
jgi:ribosome-binding protein aMBF1 (putative translation factor)